MTCLDQQQCLGSSPPRSHPYESSLSSSASTSSSSVFSVDAASSQATDSPDETWIARNFGTSFLRNTNTWSTASSASSTTPAPSSDGNDLNSFAPITRVNTYPQWQPPACSRDQDMPDCVLAPLRSDLPASLKVAVPLPAEQRQHPRRSSTVSARPPPTLVRQAERKVSFVDGLVDSATQMVECIWPLSVPSSRCEAASGRGVLPLRTFIQETLRRSRTSYSTLQVALYYLVLIKKHVPKHDFTMQQPEDTQSCRALQCGRRMFLSALILASKYLQDRNYSARAWSKISGLKVCEINMNEMAFLEAINWKLHITELVWDRWQKVVLDNSPSGHYPPPPASLSPGCGPHSSHPPPPTPGAGTNSWVATNSWRYIIPHLTPELEDVQPLSRFPHGTVESPSEFRMHTRAGTFPEGFSSQESTPTPSTYKLPRFLEPSPVMLPPTPRMPRMVPLPTPNLTPQSIASSTPAASAMAFGSRRSSMCAAMAQAQNASLARTCVDQWSVKSGLEAYQFSGRRPSLAMSSASSSSSPESMIMDNSARSSRASSISSVSSAGLAPTQTKLARLATCRSARQFHPQKPMEITDLFPMGAMSSPELHRLPEVDLEMKQFDSPMTIMHVTPEKKSKSHKRGRSSVDLQQNVRHLLTGSQSVSNLRGSSVVIPDRSVATSFLLPISGERTSYSTTGPMGLQSPKSIVPERRLPIQKDLGRKRTCASQAMPLPTRSGPGMWKDVL